VAGVPVDRIGVGAKVCTAGAGADVVVHAYAHRLRGVRQNRASDGSGRTVTRGLRERADAESGSGVGDGSRTQGIAGAMRTQGARLVWRDVGGQGRGRRGAGRERAEAGKRQAGCGGAAGMVAMVIAKNGADR
jgi:hypothetical protein